ncbi:MAG TPA: peptidase M48 [Deltaproteobacteria bacterium]|nr:MAG: hypothetical protein A2048_05305 [Deltaproteobacteria bacterium GWA2_45_12]HBF14028.1 peptidase M48 [Deltaproteobacteria bacterium]
MSIVFLGMPSNWFFLLFVCLFFAYEILENGLILLNNFHIKKNRSHLPTYFIDKIKFADFQKSIYYTLEKNRFALVWNLIKIPFLWGAIGLGLFDLFDAVLGLWLKEGTIVFSVAYCLIFAFVLLVLQVPAGLYSNFVIEKKYGFNKMTLRLFFIDLIKGIFLGALFGIPLFYLLFWLYQKMGTTWWIYGFATVFVFQLFLATIYPTFLAPLFNKFTPLEDGPLKEAIYENAKKIDFKMSGIYTIDGSKRSSHSNAYFAGMGRFRRIVLFDTLSKQMTQDEIISVLAHEMGHNKKRHIQKQLVYSLIITLAGFWVLSLLIGWQPFYNAFEAGSPAPHKAFVLFPLFSGYITFILTPFENWLSRKYEYESDRFSIEVTGNAASMKSALVNLTKKNLSNLIPHPLYSFFHYSHPTTLERVNALDRG